MFPRSGVRLAICVAALASTCRSEDIGIGDYQLTIARNGDYAEPISDPFRWTSDNLQGQKNSVLAKAALFARQMDLDRDGKPELIISSTTIIGHDHTPSYVFKVSQDESHFTYIGELGVSGGRIGVVIGDDGASLVVTTSHTGKFSVCYFSNNGHGFILKKCDEYERQGEEIIGLPDRITAMFPELR